MPMCLRWKSRGRTIPPPPPPRFTLYLLKVLYICKKTLNKKQIVVTIKANNLEDMHEKLKEVIQGDIQDVKVRSQVQY